MDFISVVLLAVALAMDCFAVSMAQSGRLLLSETKKTGLKALFFDGMA